MFCCLFERTPAEGVPNRYYEGWLSRPFAVLPFCRVLLSSPASDGVGTNGVVTGGPQIPYAFVARVVSSARISPHFAKGARRYSVGSHNLKYVLRLLHIKHTCHILPLSEIGLGLCLTACDRLII